MGEKRNAQNSIVPGRPFPPGVSGNPGGRPKVDRQVSVALAELLDTPGGDFAAISAAYRKARGEKFGASDLAALTLFEKAVLVASSGQVLAATVVMDRTEGKLGPDTEINILVSPMLIAFVDVAIEAVRPFPEALQALQQAIEARRLGG